MQCPSTQFEVTPFPSVQDKALLEKAPSGKATTMTPCSKAQFYWKLLAVHEYTRRADLPCLVMQVASPPSNIELLKVAQGTLVLFFDLSVPVQLSAGKCSLLPD